MCNGHLSNDPITVAIVNSSAEAIPKRVTVSVQLADCLWGKSRSWLAITPDCALHDFWIALAATSLLISLMYWSTQSSYS